MIRTDTQNWRAATERLAPVIRDEGVMRVRYHKSYGHGLRPGTDRDMNCPNCRKEDGC